MKKLLCILATGIALSVCATTVYFAKSANGSASAASDSIYNNSEITRVSDEVDYDCDVCDKNYADENGDGVCDNKGSCQGNGECDKNYADENGDGVCDNKGSCQASSNCDGKGSGQGNGNCGGKRSGHGSGNCGSKGSGQGNGNCVRGGCGR